MKLVSRTLISLACVAAVGVVTAMDDHHGLDKAYAKLSKALQRMDSKTVHGMLAPRFTWVDPAGRSMSRAEFIAMDNARMKTPGLKFHSVSMKNDSYDFMGDEARVRSHTNIVMSMVENGKRTKLRAISESVDTWRRGPKGEWLCFKVESVYETYEPIQ